IRALFTAPYRSNKLRTASSVALKLRLPTKIFFTFNPPENLKAGSSGRKHKRDEDGAVAQKHSAGLAKAIKSAPTIAWVWGPFNREKKEGWRNEQIHRDTLADVVCT